MRYVLILLFTCFAFSANAASFDCAKASHPLEKTICADKELSALDEQVAKLYKEKLAELFDKNAFRGQQKDWQSIMRTRCAKECDKELVKIDYKNQIATINDTIAETFSANYKTADMSVLDLTHSKDGNFSFSIRRFYVDDELKNLCQFPTTGSVKPQIINPDKARWSDKNCTIDMNFKRDAKGSVVGLELTTNQACNSYCPGGKFTLNDNFIPENNWVAGNQ